MGTKVYNNLPGFIKETDDYKAFNTIHSFYSVDEFVSS